jgi:nitric oxide reductase subunit C
MDNFVSNSFSLTTMASDRQKNIIITLLIAAFLLYSFYLYSTLPIQKYRSNEVSDRGKMVWQRYNCIACHQVYGLGGYLGPDLTNVYSIRGKDYIKAFLMAGTPTMPNFNLSDAEMNDLISYLNNIDSSGKSDPRTFTIKPDGTIEQK